MKFNPDIIVQLIRGNAPESRTLDYKRDFYGNNDDSKRGLLKDVSAFANTSGGQLILGVYATKGVNEVFGVDISQIDDQVLKMQAIIASNLEPRIDHVEFFPVEIDGKTVLVIVVPASHRSPHRIREGSRSMFVIRTSGGNEAMDTQQIREAFLRSEDFYTRAKTFQAERIAKIIGGKTPRPLAGQTNIVVHVVPLAAPRNYVFTTHDRFPEQFLVVAEHPTPVAKGFNFDGAEYSFVMPGRPAHLYTQLFRSGEYEALSSFAHDRSPTISPNHLVNFMVNSALLGLAHGQTFHNGEFIVMLSLTGADGSYLGYYEAKDNPFDRDIVIAPEVLISENPDGFESMRTVLLPALNTIFQAARHQAAYW
jgi:hypothetical protein